MRVKRTVITAALMFVAVLPTAGVAHADPSAPPPSPPSAPKTAIDHDGIYVVGTDIAPGTYASAGPVQGNVCYWKRMADLHGGDIIDNAMSKQPQLVTIDPADKAFKTGGCQPWQLTDAPAPGPQLPPAVAALIAQGQLRSYMDTLNGLTGQVGAPPLPPP